MFRSGVSGGPIPLSQVDVPPYEKGDRVWVMRGHSLRLPGLVISYHADWNLYRVVYMGDNPGRGPRAVKEWRLSAAEKERHTEQLARTRIPRHIHPIAWKGLRS